ncbi:MAG: hypothetical protein KGS48_11070 [Bacteroidetes bacterium]|nr:hypothetical protein [Bacteroidota bacterium]
MNTALPLPESAHVSGFHPGSRIWAYVCARPLTQEESSFAQAELDQFARKWTAHDQALKARTEIYLNQIVLLMVDETQAGASGCSIDKSVHFLESLSARLNVDFFERMRFFWLDENGAIQSASRPEFAQRVQEGAVGANTLVLNQLVQNLHELQHKWWLPFQESWHKKLF